MTTVRDYTYPCVVRCPACDTPLVAVKRNLHLRGSPKLLEPVPEFRLFELLHLPVPRGLVIVRPDGTYREAQPGERRWSDEVVHRAHRCPELAGQFQPRRAAAA